MIMPTILSLVRAASPLAWLRAIAAIAVAAAVLWLALALVDHGRRSALDEVRAANADSASKADAAERGVLDCPAGRWNREARRCER
jgi:hypothetical protein